MKINTQKLTEYTESLSGSPVTKDSLKYLKITTLKLTLFLMFFGLNVALTCYLYTFLVNIFIALILAWLTESMLFRYDLTLYNIVYKALFKNDKKMMECLK